MTQVSFDQVSCQDVGLASSAFTQPWLQHYDAGVPQAIPPFDRPLFTLLDAAAERHPLRPAIIFQNTTIRYGELKRRAETFAATLRLMGVNHGDRVAVMMPNLPQTVVAFWGIMKAGAVAVMMNPLNMETEIIHHLHDSGARHLVLLDLLWPKISPLRERLPVEKFIVTSIGDALSFPLKWLYNFRERRNQPQNIPYDGENVVIWKDMFVTPERYSANNAIDADDLALLQYTGGTTGLPKGVMLSHRNVGSNYRQIISVIQELAKEHHSFVAVLPFFHVYGLAVGIGIPTALMGTTLPMPRYVPQDVLKLIQKRKPTIFPGAPSVYMSLLQQKNLSSYDLKCIKLCISGSAPLLQEHFMRFQELTGATIIEGYGLTEAAPITHINPLVSTNQKINSIGMPLPSTEARIVDMEGGSLTLPAGKLGELIIRGPQVMQGYWNRPDETASALRNGWLYTGDLATMDDEGYFHIMDRKKDMIIVSGYNVYPREVDEVLLEHPHILEAVAVGVYDKVRGESLKAFIVLEPDVQLTRAEVIAWCRNKLASYKVPRSVEFRDSLPKTIVGKVLRRALRAEDDAKQERAKTEEAQQVRRAPHEHEAGVENNHEQHATGQQTIGQQTTGQQATGQQTIGQQEAGQQNPEEHDSGMAPPCETSNETVADESAVMHDTDVKAVDNIADVTEEGVRKTEPSRE